MTELEVYAKRLEAVGYSREDARKIAELYRRNGDLDGLETYITIREGEEKQ